MHAPPSGPHQRVLLRVLGWRLVVLTARHFLDLFLSHTATYLHPTDQESWGVVAGHPCCPNRHDRRSVDHPEGICRVLCRSMFARYALLVVAAAGAFFPLTLLLARLWPEMDPFRFRPSVVAAASIASARRTIKLFPLWPTHLQRVTKYELDEIVACVCNACDDQCKASCSQQCGGANYGSPCRCYPCAPQQGSPCSPPRR